MLFLHTVERLLRKQFHIVGTAIDGRELVAASKLLQPDAVVLDVGMPVLNGLEAARRIHQDTPQIKLVFLTQQTDRAYIEAAFRGGCSAYVLKQAAAAELGTAIHRVLAGDHYLSPLLGGPDWQPGDSDRLSVRFIGPALTERQQQIVQLLGQGKEAKDIAELLRVSLKTVEFHVAAVMDALGGLSAEQLQQYAARQASADR